MNRYSIIDEPQVRPWGERIVVDPILILLAAILVPFFWDPPAFGRFWMGPLWLLINGVALGSATLDKEIKALVTGAVVWLGLFFGTAATINAGLLPFEGRDIWEYVVISLFAVLFFTMLYVINLQARSHALFVYVRGDSR